MSKEKLSFYDVKGKKKFSSLKYRTVVKGNRRFAVAKVPGAKHEAWRIIGKK